MERSRRSERHSQVHLTSWSLLSLLAATTATPTEQLIAAARAQVGVTVSYDAAYSALPYPAGDVPLKQGVCTDVVIRALRHTGVDLQREVHDDMRSHFAGYPKAWGLTRPDANIDHRRVLNLRVFFEHRGKRVDDAPRPGDLLTVTVPPNRPHIMVVSDRLGPSGHLMVIHNIGDGTREEDALDTFPQTGHYRWF